MRTRSLSPILLGLLVFLGSVVQAHAGRPFSKLASRGERFALVIGNANYLTSPKLENVRNDAVKIAETFQSLGFKVTTVQDATREQMLSALGDFAARVNGAEVAVVYYAGGGRQINGVNYLIPIDFTESPDVVRYESDAIPLHAAMKLLGTARTSMVVIIDACRDNPLATLSRKSRSAVSADSSIVQRSGLAAFEPAKDTLLVYSTRDGEVASDGPPGGNSPFADALLRALQEPGLELTHVFAQTQYNVLATTNGRQQPSSYGTLEKQIVLNTAEPARSPAVVTSPAAETRNLAVDARNIEAEAAFQEVMTTRSPEVLLAFIKSFNDSRYADFARIRLEDLKRIDQLQARTAALSPAVTAPGPTQRPKKRLAFVVGINTYDNLPSDRQPKKAVSDAEGIATTLTGLGIEVTHEEDTPRRKFNEIWQNFLKSLQPGDDVIFYFSGHGIEVEGQNYLIPRDVPAVNSGDESRLREESISFSRLQSDLAERKPKTTVYILDACRNNPFKDGTKFVGGSKGLAPVPEVKGTFILFAAGARQMALDRLHDGDPEPYSVYTRRLLPLLKTKGLRLTDLALQVREEVEDLALRANPSHEQTPSYYDQLRGRICLAGCD